MILSRINAVLSHLCLLPNPHSTPTVRQSSFLPNKRHVRTVCFLKFETHEEPPSPPFPERLALSAQPLNPSPQRSVCDVECAEDAGCSRDNSRSEKTVSACRNDRSVSLQADHTLSWNLNALDRQNIHHWESLLRDQKLQKVSVDEYRRTVLIRQTAKAR